MGKDGLKLISTSVRSLNWGGGGQFLLSLVKRYVSHVLTVRIYLGWWAWWASLMFLGREGKGGGRDVNLHISLTRGSHFDLI